MDPKTLHEILHEILPPPEAPCPPPPDHHDPSATPDACKHGWVSTGKDGEPCWLICDCEDPSRPWAPRAPTDGPVNCTCYHCFGRPREDRGRDPCEYADHHCEMCHDLGHCTALACTSKEA